MEPKRSVVAKELDSLQSSVRKVVTTRDTLPHRLFWSLFHHRIDAIKKKKEARRYLCQLLYNQQTEE